MHLTGRQGAQEVEELASHTAAKAALVKAADEVSALMEQVSALEGECEALQQELSASRVRESALQTLVDTQQPGDQLVAFDAHMAVVHENASLKAQIEQLKQDLEFLYMDHNFLTHHGTSGGAGGSGGELAQMTTAARLASLLAPSEMRTSGSHMSFAVRSAPCIPGGCSSCTARCAAVSKNPDRVSSCNVVRPHMAMSEEHHCGVTWAAPVVRLKRAAAAAALHDRADVESGAQAVELAGPERLPRQRIQRQARRVVCQPWH